MTDNRLPLVSVIVPTHNREHYLEEALCSVLAQTYAPLEIVVVDDGSTDGTRSLVARLGNGVRYIHQVHSGAGAARNRGVAESTGEYLAFLDSDDLWERDKIARQVAALEAETSNDAVFVHVRQFFSSELSRPERTCFRVDDRPMPGFIPSAMAIRRQAFLRIGPFEEGLGVGEFMAWYMRAQEGRLSAVMLPECLCCRRVHHGNKGRINQEHAALRARIIKAALDRRRTTGSAR